MSTSSEAAVAPPARVVVEDHIMLVTINRPAMRNAVDRETSVLLGDALEAAERDSAVYVVVLTGAGSKAFCAGADLKALARGEVMKPPGREHWGFAGWTNHPISKPVISAVNGAAMGGGCELVLAGDLAVAGESATFGLPEVKRGLIAAAGGAVRLPAQIPTRVALDLLLTGRVISASEALALNLVNRVVPDDEVLAEAMGIARTVAANAPLAVQGTKRIALGVRDGVATDEAERWAINAVETEFIKQTADAAEGARAFVEKRAAQWTSS